MSPVIERIVVVKDQTIGTAIEIHRLASGAAIAVITLEDEIAATLIHPMTLSICVRAGDARRAAHHNLVGTVCFPAAEIEGDEQVVVVLSTDNARGLDGAA